MPTMHLIFTGTYVNACIYISFKKDNWFRNHNPKLYLVGDEYERARMLISVKTKDLQNTNKAPDTISSVQNNSLIDVKYIRLSVVLRIHLDMCKLTYGGVKLL